MGLVIGIDPGLTTGWCAIETTEKGMKVVDWGQVQWRAIIDWGGQGAEPGDIQRLFDLVFSEGISALVIEDFVGTGPRDHAMTRTMNAVGYFIALAHQAQVTPTLHVPKKRRPFIDLASQMLSEGKKGRNRHAVDAGAQALAYIHSKKAKEED